MTEIAGIGTSNLAYTPHKLGSVGVQVPLVECRIADAADASRTLAPGEVGELMVRGPIVMQGYFGNEEATRETIESDGWLHTGDLAQIDGDGYIFIVDRKKDMILTGGFNVYPAEIERVVAQHPAVAMVAVGSMPDELKGEIAKAYVVLRSGAHADEAEIVTFCRKHLAAYKLPRAVQFVPDLPKTSTGQNHAPPPAHGRCKCWRATHQGRSSRRERLQLIVGVGSIQARQSARGSSNPIPQGRCRLRRPRVEALP